MSLDVYIVKRKNVGNVTHNLNKMAVEAGLYHPLWRPEEIDVTTTNQMVSLLEVGLKVLKNDPEHFKKFEAENGYGTYEGLVDFVTNYLEACKENPDCGVEACR
jgi:hypothetical protein